MRYWFRPFTHADLGRAVVGDPVEQLALLTEDLEAVASEPGKAVSVHRLRFTKRCAPGP